MHESLPGSSQRQWIYQFRNSEDLPWTPGYGFTEIEFFQHDFEVMNFFTSQSSGCFLTSHLLVVKFLREGEEVYGKITLYDDKVKKNIGGNNMVVHTCVTEPERVKVLEDQFGVILTEEEQKGIEGRIPALPMHTS